MTLHLFRFFSRRNIFNWAHRIVGFTALIMAGKVTQLYFLDDKGSGVR